MEGNLLNDFTTVNFRELDIICEKALKAGQWLFILDKTDRASVYFEYKAT